MVKKRLIQNGENVVSHHFPSYGTYQGAAVEKYLSGEYGKPSELSPYFINSLYASDRAITWNTILKEKFNKGSIILLDRYTTSSLIYQSALIEDIDERKKFIDYIIDFEYKKLGIQEPDIVVFLTAPFELVTKMRNERKQNEGISSDIHESNLEFMKKVYDNALFVADYLKWHKVECSKTNEMKTINEIHEEVYKLVKMK